MRNGQVAAVFPRAALLLSAMGLWCLVGCNEEKARQLLFLNQHAKHESLNMACESCHTGAKEEAQAGIPSVRKCAFCHLLDRSDPPTPPELAKYLKTGEAIPWTRVNRLPGHVYFSHVVHTKYTEMDCSECHGSMTDRPSPTAKSPSQPLDMNGCIDCHRRQQASIDCLTCHK